LIPGAGARCCWPPRRGRANAQRIATGAGEGFAPGTTSRCWPLACATITPR
jgi:hypothetical protein